MALPKKTSLKISAKAAKIGMYVCHLDRPWQQTPFPIEGFYIRELNEIKQLNVHCKYIFIDPDKGITPDAADLVVDTQIDAAKKPYRGELKAIKASASTYCETVPLNQEMAKAHNIYHTLLSEFNLVMEQIANGTVLSIEKLFTLSVDMVDSFIRNPDALLWLVRACKTDDRPCYYLLRCASWAILFGRHLGLSKSDLRALGLSIFLKDAGRFQGLKQLPINHGSSNVHEQQPLLEKTIAFLKTVEGLPPKVIKTIKMHYERINGSGFPNQLKGDDIYLLSKIMGIACYYDQISYLDGKKCAVSTSKAVSSLYEVRGIQFQDDIVVEFIQAIGLYPTGTLVKLTNQEVGAVVEQNYQRRLKPKVMVVVDTQGDALDAPKLVDLFEDELRKKAGKKLKGEASLDIVQDIEPYDYPIKVSKIRYDHIEMNRQKSFFSRFKLKR